VTALANLTVESVDGVVVAGLDGEIDLSNANELSARIAEAAADAPGGLALDLSGVDYLDSTGLRMLLNLASTLREGGHALRLVVKEDSFVSSLMDTTGVRGILPVGESRDEAVRELGEAP
jgi:anti-sigma B factor antagonist